MSFLNSKLYISILSLLFFIACYSASATTCLEKFDLEGDGELKQIEVPFPYYKRQQSDRFSFIYQGGYKVFNIQNSQNEVAVIGALRPCIAIIVTDGINLITMHKHSTNSLESMHKIIDQNLDLSDKSKLRAYIHTTKDDVEWIQNQRVSMHGGRTHAEEIKRIKDFLEKEIGILREYIPASLFNLRNQEGKLKCPDQRNGRYELVETVIAIRLN